QIAYNKEHNIDPKPLRKKISDITELLAREEADTDALLGKKAPRGLHSALDVDNRKKIDPKNIPQSELADLIVELSTQMTTAAGELQFELAGRLRDEIADLKQELRQMVEANK